MSDAKDETNRENKLKTPAKETRPLLTTTLTTSSSSMPTPTVKSPLKSPLMPAKLATLSKPASLAKTRSARHSIDVRALPSYLAKKRQSTFGLFLSGMKVLSPTAPTESDNSSSETLFKEPIAPTLSLGERVAWVQTSGPEFGSVRWIGRMPQITTDWTVGVEFDNSIGNGDGTLEGRRYFIAKENFAKFLPLSALTKVDNYMGRPRSGTMLSRMSVQLKPGQLISIQRNPSVHVEHCSLNAPHHVGHDVHFRNANHCLCASCNHPCAHICRTSGPKWRKNQMAHMCHFSSKPHNRLCCGGEDLPQATQPLTHMGMSWMHSEAIASYRTVQTPYFYGDDGRRKSIASHDSRVQSYLETKHLVSPQTSTLKDRADSVLSISSLPSSGSPAQVFIERGVLTDESDLDDSDRCVSPDTRLGRLLSLWACFSMKPYSLRSHKRREERRRRRKRSSNKLKPEKHTTFVETPERTEISNHSDLSYESGGEPTQSSRSHNHSSSLTSSAHTSKGSANVSPAANRSKSSPNTQSTNVSDRSPADHQSKSRRTIGRISEESECQNCCKNNNHALNGRRSQASQRSSNSEPQSPGKYRKGRAPTPEPSPLTISPAVSAASLPLKTADAKSQSNCNLTRSLSEQKQLNMKNLINAVPSFRSEVDLNRVSRSSADQLTASVESSEVGLVY